MINIAIDGPSAAGKSTIAKLLAKQLGYVHIDTGAMYRCCAYQSLKNNIELNDLTALDEMLQHMEISFDKAGNVFINGEDVSKNIRTNEISMRTSSIAKILLVREKMVAKQREMAKAKGFILDGRDIGTVVLPDAEVKIFMVASVEARAKRRFEEYKMQGVDVDYDQIAKDIEQRDYQDMNRETSPLKKADDAIEIDTSLLNIEQVVNKVLSIIQKKEKQND
ncbi:MULTISPECIES: (d)CMP kinase [unclassified Breznakia]|uniref:(d)CMP kinase n=1 Tax=unclassified Breznakia TaxID=2623764 RepID=UPI0024740998|nr:MULTISPECIES: (d)CMP kinase [unclassified Breznakia]MDH6366375.1 cytidylate kinase [Breznakia sp. PH1-1]MDH6403468.1 cytidylate kinase [Breznakia sp. PF1-11]MDH6411177.1 cytidylate kinase [Breznakia sp. PFB1-11]MDH6413560.1 cytidylate kinase [Breznakia sp. PFB1-14]MDH6415722.1 cytidylate kinase [Breznakia sp. PFB1-4]